MAVPKAIQAGVTLKISAKPGDTLTANSGTHIITLTESGGYFTLAHDANYQPGRYRYTITDTSNELVDAGIFQMLPSLATGDGRTETQRIYEAICARLAGTATQGQASIQIDGKSIRYLTISELERAKRVYEELLEDEITEITGKSRTDSYYAKFTRP